MSIPRLRRVARQRLRSLVRPVRADSELDREIAFHLEQLTQEKIADGLSADEARLAARREFGNPAAIVERCRDERRVRWIQDLRQDVVYGLRTLRRAPVFTTVVVLSLALGIGGNAVVLGAMRSVFAAPLPFRDADRLVVIRSVPGPGFEGTGASLSEYLAWKDQTRSFDEIELSLSGPRLFHAEAGGAPAESIPGMSVTPRWFDVLGATPARGRLFGEADAQLPVVVVSYRLWQQRFGGREDVIGRHVLMNNVSRRIVAVMPPDFRYLADNIECWMPLVLGPEAVAAPGSGRLLTPLARLRADATIEDAQAELDVIAAGLAVQSPSREGGWRVRALPLREAMYGWTRTPLVTLLAAVVLVLAITCTNVAGLSLARATARRRELVVRTALGAGRWRIIRQLMTESVLLALVGGVLGLSVAAIGLRVLTATLGPPPAAPRIGALGPDDFVVAVIVLLALASAVAFGTSPAIAGTRADPATDLNASPSSGSSLPGAHRSRAVLVTAQIALSVVLLIGAGLLARSFQRLAGRKISMDVAGVLSFEYSVPPAARARENGGSVIDSVADRLRQLPGVAAVAGISYPPVNSLVLPRVRVSAPDRAAHETSTVAHFLVTPGFFTLMRTPIHGREITARDTPASPPVAVINDAAARRFWPDDSAIGKRLRLHDGTQVHEREIVGVAGDIPTRLKQLDPEPVIYTPYAQPPPAVAGRPAGPFGRAVFVIRRTADADPAAVLSAVGSTVATLPPHQPIVSAGVLERHLTARREESRNYVIAVGALAATATLLCAIGVFGITALAVTERTREIGIRRALGAGAAEIGALVSRRILPLIVVGVAVGLAGSIAASRLISSQLWGISATDATTYGAVCLLLVLIAVAACVPPTRRALAIDPSVVLRSE